MLWCPDGAVGDEKGAKVTEEQFPDEEPEIVQDDDTLPDQAPGAAPSMEPDPVSGEPDNHPGPAENNPDRGREDPLLEAVSGEEEDFLSEQTLTDDTQRATNAPTLEEAAADVDSGEAPSAEEVEAGDGQAAFGGSPLSQFDPEDLEQ